MVVFRKLWRITVFLTVIIILFYNLVIGKQVNRLMCVSMLGRTPDHRIQ